eukprot:gene34687-44858_t
MSSAGGNSETVKWILGPKGYSCSATCSLYLPSATCSTTATWPSNSSDLQTTQLSTYDFHTNQIQTSCTGAPVGDNPFHPPSFDGFDCWYTTASPPQCSSSLLLERLFCPCNIPSTSISTRWILGPTNYSCSMTCKASMSSSYCVTTTAGITTAAALTALEAITYDYNTNTIQTTCTASNIGWQWNSVLNAAPTYYKGYCHYGTGAPACYFWTVNARLFCPCALPSPTVGPSIAPTTRPSIAPTTTPTKKPTAQPFSITSPYALLAGQCLYDIQGYYIYTYTICFFDYVIQWRNGEVLANIGTFSSQSGNSFSIADGDYCGDT